MIIVEAQKTQKYIDYGTAGKDLIVFSFGQGDLYLYRSDFLSKVFLKRSQRNV
jgi:hypothetical protein